MSDMIQSDYALEKEAAEIAQSIFDEFKDENGGASFDAEAFRDEMMERAWQDVDGSQNVIYTARAIAICGNCDTDAGEEWLEGIYGKPFDGCDSFAEVCTRLAFATLLQATESALDDLITDWEPDEPAEDEEEEDEAAE